MSSRSRQGPKKHPMPKRGFVRRGETPPDFLQCLETFQADAIGILTAEREDGLEAPAVSLAADGVELLFPFTRVEELDEAIDALVAEREKHFGTRGA